MRAVTYARVSGDDRHTEGRNLTSQGKMTRDYAMARGYQLVAELAEDDRGASGASFELEQLNHVREMARNKEFDVLVVRELDRLSRNLAKQLIVEEEFKRNSVKIEYVLGEYPDTPEGNLQKNVKAIIAEYEREKTRERTRRGRVEKAKSGKLVGNCLPHGYKKIGKGDAAEILIDKEEAAVVQQIFKWFLTEKTSLRQIGFWLTSSGMPVPGVDYNHPGSSVWSSTTIRRILSNTSYIGQFNYGGISIYRSDLAIIGNADFQLVQDILNNNRQWQRRKGRDATPGRYLSLDYIFCSCGCRMTVTSLNPGKIYRYYACGTYSYPKQKNPHREIMVRVSNADAIVWTWLEMLLGMDEIKLRKGLNQIAAQRENQSQLKRDRLDATNAQIDNVSKKITGLMRTFSGDEDEDVIAALREQVNGLKKTKTELVAQRDRFAADLSESVLTGEQVDDIVTFARRIRGKMANASFDNKRELMKTLNVRVDLVREEDCYRLDMSCDLPGSENSEILKLCESYSSNKKVVSP
jgi:site-specific DNA recombinase